MTEADLRHDIMTSQEVMRLLRVSRHVLKKGIESGAIPCFTFAGQMRFMRSDVLAIFTGKKSTPKVENQTTKANRNIGGGVEK